MDTTTLNTIIAVAGSLGAALIGALIPAMFKKRKSEHGDNGDAVSLKENNTYMERQSAVDVNLITKAVKRQ